jgi:hypothetical protein
VAENNRDALAFYRHRNFYKLDAAIFMAQKVASEPELLPPRRLKTSGEHKLGEAGDEGAVAVLELPDAREPEAPAAKYKRKAGTAVPARPKRPTKKKRRVESDES